MIVGITGHRPKYNEYNLPNPTYIYVCQELEKLFLKFKPEKVITGMALGFDTWCAIVCQKLNLPFLAAIPCEGQEKLWKEYDQKLYHKLLKVSAEQIIISPGKYASWKMQARNKYIVDNCDLLIAYFDQSLTSGGTYNCVEYAKSINRKIEYINIYDK